MYRQFQNLFCSRPAQTSTELLEELEYSFLNVIVESADEIEPEDCLHSCIPITLPFDSVKDKFKHFISGFDIRKSLGHRRSNYEYALEAVTGKKYDSLEVETSTRDNYSNVSLFDGLTSQKQLEEDIQINTSPVISNVETCLDLSAEYYDGVLEDCSKCPAISSPTSIDEPVDNLYESFADWRELDTLESILENIEGEVEEEIEGNERKSMTTLQVDSVKKIQKKFRLYINKKRENRGKNVVVIERKSQTSLHIDSVKTIQKMFRLYLHKKRDYRQGNALVDERKFLAILQVDSVKMIQKKFRRYINMKRKNRVIKAVYRIQHFLKKCVQHHKHKLELSIIVIQKTWRMILARNYTQVLRSESVLQQIENERRNQGNVELEAVLTIQKFWRKMSAKFCVQALRNLRKYEDEQKSIMPEVRFEMSSMRKRLTLLRKQSSQFTRSNSSNAIWNLI